MLRLKTLHLFLSLALLSCSAPKENITLSGLDIERFDTIVGGQQIALHRLTNARGMELCVTNYGARIVSLMVPDRDGVMRDVVLGFDNIADYLANRIPFGATVGRNANRIRDGHFILDGEQVILAPNDGTHSLHGGPEGWQGQIFELLELSDSSILLGYRSPDGESGFPGNVSAQVRYALDESNTLNISYEAITDKPTVINLTNHSYFALTGDPSITMMNSSVLFDSDYYTPKAPDQIPNGQIASVEGTPMDLRSPTVLAERLVEGAEFEDIKISHGFGVTLIFRNEGTGADVVVRNPESGIVMELFTSQPSIQFYSCNTYDKQYIGKHGIEYHGQNAICLEAQHYPNAVNNPSWPSPIIRPGESYQHYCNYRFSVE